MTDRELLEDAAKAAGWTWWRSKHGYWNLTAPDGAQHTACHGWAKFDPHTGEAEPEPTPGDALLQVGFCPLTDDGDALRLAVKLGLRVHKTTSSVEIDIYKDGAWADTVVEKIEHDPLAATRRAIVRAAAEIGRSKE